MKMERRLKVSGMGRVNKFKVDGERRDHDAQTSTLPAYKDCRATITVRPVKLNPYLGKTQTLFSFEFRSVEPWQCGCVLTQIRTFSDA